jgi:hypothetical protein
MVQTKEMSGLPWTFFIYLVFIIALAIVGAMYQIMYIPILNIANCIDRTHTNKSKQISFNKEYNSQSI